MAETSNMTYKQLIKRLQQAIKETPEMADELVCLYQTDNWSRQVTHVQTGFGGNFIAATREWQGK